MGSRGVETCERVAPCDPAVEPSFDLGGRLRAHHDESRRAVRSRDGKHRCIARKRPMERAFEHGREQHVAFRTERRAFDLQYQRATPHLDAERAKSGQRQIPAEMLDHFRNRSPGGHALGDSAPDFGAEPTSEITRLLLPCARAKMVQGVRRYENAGVSASHRHSPLAELESDGVGWIERVCHREERDSERASMSFCEYTRSVRRAVKSRRKAASLCSGPMRGWAAARLGVPAGPFRGGLFLGVVAAALPAESARGQLLLGEGFAPGRPVPVLDSRIPTGAEMVTGFRPETSPEPGACSFRAAVCVHRGPGVSGSTTLGWLAQLEIARERLVDVLGLPPPTPDASAGGGPALDLYVVPGESGLEVFPDALDVPRPVDTAPAFCTVGSLREPSARDATLCIAEAIAIRLDASETPFSRRALASELWLVVGAPTSEDAARIDDTQAHPERAIVARDRTPYAEGAALFDEFLAIARGRSAPSDVALAMYALSAGPPSANGFRYVNEPDVLDVLRATFGPKPTDFAKFIGDFAVARAFVGNRDSEATFPALDWVGDFGRVRFEWSVPFSSLPRHLAPSRPVEPTGSTYLWVDLDEPHEGASLAFRAEWEPPAAFAWQLVSIDAEGHVQHRVDVPFLERETRVQRTMLDLRNARGVLIAGTNLGGLGPSYPFDPDFEPFEPHAYDVYLVRQ